MKKTLKHIIFIKMMIFVLFALSACKFSRNVKEYIERGFNKPAIGDCNFEPYNTSTTTQKKYAPAGEEISLKVELNNPYNKKMEVVSVDVNDTAYIDGNIKPEFINGDYKNLVIKFKFSSAADADTENPMGKIATFAIRVKEPNTGDISELTADVPCNSPPDISKLKIVWDGIECCFKVENFGSEDIKNISYEVNKSGDKYHSQNSLSLYKSDTSINKEAWTFKPSDDIENKIYIGKQILISNSLRLEDYAGLVSEKCTDPDIEKMPDYDKLNLKFIFEGENKYANVLPWDGNCMLPSFNNIRSVVSTKSREVVFPDHSSELITHEDLIKVGQNLKKKDVRVSNGKKESKYQIKLTDEEKTVDAKFETILFPPLEKIINIKDCTFEIVDLEDGNSEKANYRELVKDSICTEDNNKKLYFGERIVYKMSGFLNQFQEIDIKVDFFTQDSGYECISPSFGKDCMVICYKQRMEVKFSLGIYAGDENNNVPLGCYDEVEVYVGYWISIKNLTTGSGTKIIPKIDKNSIVKCNYKNFSDEHVLLMPSDEKDEYIKVNLTSTSASFNQKLKFHGYQPNVVSGTPRKPGLDSRLYINNGGNEYIYSGNSKELKIYLDHKQDSIQDLEIWLPNSSLIVYYTQE